MVKPRALIDMPEWVNSGDPKAFFGRAGIRARRLSDERWQVITDESYRAVADAKLVRTSTPVTAAADDPLVMPAPSTLFHEGAPDEDTRRGLATLRDQASRHPSLESTVSLMQVHAMSASHEDTPEAVADILDALRTLTITGGERIPPFGDATATVVVRSEPLLHRLKMPSMILRSQLDPRLASGDISHLEEALSRNEVLFSSGSGLHEGHYTLDAFLAPLMSCLSPAVWGFAAPRTFGAILISFGRGIAGTRPYAAELLNSLPLRAPGRSYDVPTITRTNIEQAISWWCSRLNGLFGRLSDPVAFADIKHTYSAHTHLQGLITIEQLFRRVASCQAAHRDVDARLPIFFTVMDTLERITGRKLDDACNPIRAREVCSRVEAAIPAEARALFAPLIQRGLHALMEIEDNFFLKDRRGMVPLDTTRPPASAARATGLYVKMLRNATHGHGTNRSGKVAEVESLLARHTGIVAPDLTYLTLLYLLDFLVSGGRVGTGGPWQPNSAPH